MSIFTIPGEPQGKARARTFYHEQAKKVVSMTPEKTVNYENLIKLIYNGKKFEGQVGMKIDAYYGIPKSATRGKSFAMEHNLIRPTKKPDADNVAKVICDSLNGIAYRDDTQIVDLHVKKFYSNNPRVEVTLREAEDTYDLL